MTGLLGQNLIFVISQPRAGSTLLQRILGSHSEVHTVSEPWIMLHPLYALRGRGYSAEYDSDWERTAVRGFAENLGGEQVYYDALRLMYGYLYDRALAGTGKRFFLDKTPRYYLIIPELHRVFPEAKYIFLFRNPLAVLCSIFNHWTEGNWFNLSRFRQDLNLAPNALLNGVRVTGERGIVVHYETLTADPDKEIGRICSELGMDFEPAMIDYGRHNLPRWKFGDQESVHQHTRPIPQTAGAWEKSLDAPQVWRIVSDYLVSLGPDLLEELGYPYAELRELLDRKRPGPIRSRLTVPLRWLQTSSPKQRACVGGFVRVRSSIRRRGWWGTFMAALDKI